MLLIIHKPSLYFCFLLSYCRYPNLTTTAAFRCADLGLDTVLVEKYNTLGGVCLNVGCIPSKALLHVSKVIEEAKALGSHGVTFGSPEIDLDKIRSWKEKQVVGQLTGGLAGMAKMRKVKVVNGTGTFTSSNSLEVIGEEKTTINFKVTFNQYLHLALKVFFYVRKTTR